MVKLLVIGHNSIKVYQLDDLQETPENMVLNRVREKIEPIMNWIGGSLAKTGFSPNFWTLLGLVFSGVAGVAFAIRPNEPYIAALFLVLTGILDVVDGAVARAMKMVSKVGSFNDSTLDRVAEVMIYAGIVYGGYTSSYIVLLAVGFSLLVSYARAKGESLGISLSGIGIGERAERLIVLIIFSFAGIVWLGVWIVLILALITFIQRYYSVIFELGRAG